MADYTILVVEFLQTPGLPLRVGIMMGAAVILGFLLYCDYKDILKWVVSVVIYVAFQEWIRYAFVEANGSTAIDSLATAIAIISAIVFALGLSIGAYIGAKRTTVCSDGDLSPKKLDKILIL